MGTGVSVGEEVMVAVGVNDALGVAVGAGAGDVQEIKKERRKKGRNLREKVVMFCMGCILPLVDKFPVFLLVLPSKHQYSGLLLPAINA